MGHLTPPAAPDQVRQCVVLTHLLIMTKLSGLVELTSEFSTHCAATDGSQRTGKFTEFAMKQSWCARE
jgi:hypothetical protein